jgi:hypothetical protein
MVDKVVHVLALVLGFGASFPLERFLLTAKIVVVEILGTIVFFKWLFKAFFKEMRK